MLARNDLPDYIADNYGECALAGCYCLRKGWIGRACPHWKPVKARDWDELLVEMRRIYAPRA